MALLAPVRRSGLLIRVVAVLVSVLLSVLGGMACTGPQRVVGPVPGGLPAESGTFTNDTCVAQPQPDGTTSYTKTVYELTPTTWAADVTSYGDEGCTSRLGTVHLDGPYTITGPSPTVPGAFDVELGFAHRTVTPHVDGYVALMESLSCGTAPALDVPQDVLTAGCPEMGLPPLSTCPREYELMKLDGTSLTFGKRVAGADACTPARRPSELSSLSSRHVP